MFVIITDGRKIPAGGFPPTESSYDRARKGKVRLEFVFLGANIDAVETAGKFGISADRAVDYVPDGRGTELNFQMMSEAVADFRETACCPGAAGSDSGDHKKRGKRR